VTSGADKDHVLAVYGSILKSPIPKQNSPVGGLTPHLPIRYNGWDSIPMAEGRMRRE
jgi:hypothetical protein